MMRERVMRDSGQAADGHPAYRPDIDGMRAFAVLAVLAFHANIPQIPGGFAGVDVFFVISGYLITSLLVKEWRRDRRISLSGFWARRVRRLAPALLLVVLAVILAAVFALQRMSGETGSVARATLWTLAVNANHFFLAQDGDYFGPGTATNPLLHMWSLAVEEQFYLLWPIALAACAKYGGMATIKRLTVWIMLISLALSCYWTISRPAVAFYVMPSRAWELMIGGLLAIVVVEKRPALCRAHAEALAWTGLVMLLVSMTLLTKHSAFPGPSALLPVVGTALLILAGCNASAPWVSRALATAPLRYVGKISYPLYLWHWPLLVIPRSSRLYEESLALDLAALALAFVLAAATYEFVEKRVWSSFRQLGTRRILVTGLAANMAVLCVAVGIGAWVRFGWGYSAQELALDNSRKDMPQRDCVFQEFPSAPALDACYPRGTSPTVLLWGDSHANHWRPGVAKAAADEGIRAATLTMSACRPLPGPVGRDDCVAFNQQVIQQLTTWQRERGLVGLVLSARWPEGTGTLAPSLMDAGWKPGEYFDRRARTQDEALAYFEGELHSLFRTAAANHLRVVMVLPSPVQKFAASHCLSLRTAPECMVPVVALSSYTAPAELVIRKVAAGYANVRLLDPRSFMCPGGTCAMVIGDTIVYTDHHHVSKTFSLRHSAEFKSALAWIAGRRIARDSDAMHEISNGGTPPITPGPPLPASHVR